MAAKQAVHLTRWLFFQLFVFLVCACVPLFSDDPACPEGQKCVPNCPHEVEVLSALTYPCKHCEEEEMRSASFWRGTSKKFSAFSCRKPRFGRFKLYVACTAPLVPLDPCTPASKNSYEVEYDGVESDFCGCVPIGTDADGDGFEEGPYGDCNDGDPTIYPGAPVDCANGYDDDRNCNGVPDSSDCSPLVIDVAGNGFDLTNRAGGVDFDLHANGDRKRIPWTAPNSDDAWLVLDRNGNGLIDSGAELFGGSTPQPSRWDANGYFALAVFDQIANGGNGDWTISNADQIFGDLRLWRDSNHNGIADAGELSPLSFFGISAIDLDFRTSQKRDNHGNLFRFRSKAHYDKGEQRFTYDVILSAP